MVKIQDKLKFRDDFPPVSTEEWEEKILKDLKGADYEKKLIWKPLEGFKVRPYYRAEDLGKIKYLEALPGVFPYVRGKMDKENKWYIRQDIDTKNGIEESNKKALEILQKGVDSLGFIINEEKDFKKDDLNKLLKDICIPAIELNFVANHGSMKIVDLLIERLENEDFNSAELTGSVDFNPLGNLTIKGKFCKSADYSFDQCKTIIEKGKILPSFHVLQVDAFPVHNAGATAVQELGAALAMGNEYLANLTEKGLNIDDIASAMRFKFGSGSSYFIEIAKLRAARMLWAKIVEAYNPSNESSAKMYIHSETSHWNQTIYDPYVNMLRGTTESMSAALGGADSIIVTPYDKAFETPTEFAGRIARNTQIILKEEAYLDKVVDPAGGSYLIENLTQSIAEHAWSLFQEIENAGGYIEAFKKGLIQEKIKEVANKRNHNIAAKKEALVGVNLYPNPNEVMEKGYNEDTVESSSQEAGDAIAEPLKPYRGAEEIELMRLKTDRNADRRPKVFLLTIGDKTMRRARAQFSSGFFAAAGFEIIDNIGFDTVEEGIKEAKEKNAEIIVICSSDPEYPEIAPKVAEMAENDNIVVVAGYPKDSIEMLKEKGIQYFIHIKSNLIETLQKFQEELGIV
ncbi:MAG: methylmalonyl-CoA mutase family protein [Bacteroidales bacterium]